MSREFAFPETRPYYAADRVVDIEHIKIAVDIDVANKVVRGVVTLRITALAEVVNQLELDAVELTISAVRMADKAVEFSHDGKKLRIDLASRLKAGSTTTVEISYAGAPRRGLYFIAPDADYPDKPLQVWSQGQDIDSRYWFPCFDAPHEKATSEVVVTVPAHMFALSNGTLLSDRVHGKKRTLHWQLNVPHSCYLITLAIGDFATITEHWRDIPVTYYVERGREAAAARTLARTPQMLELFSTQFGVAYPYPQYAQVLVSDFIFGGMENTSATTLTDTILMDERAALDYDIDSLVAHELAHQWFGDLVTCRDWGEGWLNEGFATYAEYLWREHHEGRDAADLELDDWAEMYFGEDAGRYRRTIATKMYQEPIDIFDHHLYDKGGRVLHMLRNVVGDTAFFKALGHYLRKHQFGSVESRDLARAFEDATGRVLDWFFDQWVLRGAGHPVLDVGMTWDGKRKMLVVTVSQTQTIDATTPRFRIPTVVRVVSSAGATRDIAIDITEITQTFHLPLSAEPSQAVFDPGGVVLAKTTTTKPLPWWRNQLRDAALGFDRISAARVMSNECDRASTAALTHTLSHDVFWAAREAAAMALAARRGIVERDILLKALPKEKHLRARRGVVRALGLFVHDEIVATALAKLVHAGDKSYFVEAEACLSLGKTRSALAEPALREAATRESFTDVVRQHAFRGLAEARCEAAVPLLLNGARRGRISQGRRAATTALAQLVRGRRDAAARQVREALESLLRDSDFRVQAAALEAIGTIGDPLSIATIDTMIAVELDGRLRRRGREIIRAIGEASGTTDEVRRLRDDVESLRALTTTLRERLDGLEANHPHDHKHGHQQGRRPTVKRR